MIKATAFEKSCFDNLDVLDVLAPNESLLQDEEEPSFESCVSFSEERLVPTADSPVIQRLDGSKRPKVSSRTLSDDTSSIESFYAEGQISQV